MRLIWFIKYNYARIMQESRALLRTIAHRLRSPAFLKAHGGQLLTAGDSTAVALPLGGLPDEKEGWHGDEIPRHGALKGVVRGIAGRLRMERQLRSAIQELTKKNALIADLLINVSHEFRTPLSVIQMAAELLNDYLSCGEMDVEQLRHSVDIININARRLTRLVGNMLDITKIKAGVKQPLLSPVNIVELLRKLVELAKPCARKRGLEISLACRKTVRVLRTDPELVARIVVNLLSNAIKFTPRGGWVRVTLKCNVTGCRITVEDNGEGIPKDMQRRIFDHFHRANNTLARSSEGCGIGLSLTKSLAELLGGSIKVKSTPGRGSTFFVYLPDRREAGVQQNTGLMSAQLQDLVLTELADISI